MTNKRGRETALDDAWARIGDGISTISALGDLLAAVPAHGEIPGASIGKIGEMLGMEARRIETALRRIVSAAVDERRS